MEKTAQRRSVLNKLREMTNVSGIAAEKFFNPEFKKVMESLRKKDDQIRSLVAGAAIGEGDPGSDPVALKDILKFAKSNLNRREYMMAVADLGRFHKKLSDVAKEISSLNFDIDAVHQQFLFGTDDDPILKPEHKEHLQYLKNRFAQEQFTLVKQAGLMDFFYNIGTKRGRALAAWEKRYPDKAKPLSKQTAVILAHSDALLEKILSSLKEMASARSVRNVDAYMKSAGNITKLYDKYHKSFTDYYKNVVQPIIKDIELTAPVKPADIPAEIADKNIPVGTPSDMANTLLRMPAMPGSQGPTGTMRGAPNPAALVPPGPPPPTVNEPVAPTVNAPAPPSGPVTSPVFAPPSDPNAAPPTMRSPQPIMSSSHRNFLNSLETLSGESPLLLASYISKYAKSIQDTSPDVAISLFKISKSIKE
jgi:hypothetical protein